MSKRKVPIRAKATHVPDPSPEELWDRIELELPQRYLFLVRLIGSKELVGVFYAESEIELMDLIDHETDPGSCECRAFEHGNGLFFNVGAPAVGLDLRHEDEEQRDANYDGFHKRFNEVGISSVDDHNEWHDEDGWVSLGEAPKRAKVKPYVPKHDAEGYLLPERRVLPRDLPKEDRPVAPSHRQKVEDTKAALRPQIYTKVITEVLDLIDHPEPWQALIEQEDSWLASLSPPLQVRVLQANTKQHGEVSPKQDDANKPSDDVA